MSAVGFALRVAPLRTVCGTGDGNGWAPVSLPGDGVVHGCGGRRRRGKRGVVDIADLDAHHSAGLTTRTAGGGAPPCRTACPPSVVPTEAVSSRMAR